MIRAATFSFFVLSLLLAAVSSSKGAVTGLMIRATTFSFPLLSSFLTTIHVRVGTVTALRFFGCALFR
jgi:hypothetical protein